ncbi:hypothetical protein ABAC402_10845 [Asticcacaulis sp. AC402]|nr:hypothetical protein ABAC402_10845 [Asticcacaulis sp. AC402]
MGDSMEENMVITRRQGLVSFSVGALGLSTSTGLAAEGSAPFRDFESLPAGVRMRQGGYTIDVCLSGADTVSVIKYPHDRKPPLGFFLPSTPSDSQATFKNGVLRLGKISVSVDSAVGRLRFAKSGVSRLEDLGGQDLTTFHLAKEADLYGLGQFRDPHINYRNKSVYLAQGNMDAINPMLVSTDGLGLLWDTGTDSHFTSRGKSVEFTNPSPVTRYHVFLGDTLEEVIASYRRLTGKAPLLPKYAYGFWQSQERYNTQKELTDVLDGYRTRNLPVDVMVQDWGYWGDASHFSGMVWDKQRFPDPAGMCRHVHSQNAHIIATVWPAVGTESKVYKALDQKALLLNVPHWSGGRVVDMTSPEARSIYWEHIRDGLLSVGLDGLWTDGTEPEFLSTGSRYVTTQAYVSAGLSHAGPISEHSLTFSYLQAQLLYNKMREHRPDRRPFILTRSAYAGQQAFNAITWSGDIFASWQTLRNQIVAAQQMSLSGIPYWTNDIGAFLVTHRFPKGLASPSYRELYVRWFQYGAFLPIFRAHGTQIRRELWAIGGPDDPCYLALKGALERRYALLPYIYSLAAKVTLEHAPLVRPLVLDFGHDQKINAYPHQYMFGQNILVCPVTTPLLHDQEDPYEFLPNYAVKGHAGPAAEVIFYEGENFERKVEERLTDDLKMSWFGDLPAALKGKPYSAIWRGKIIAQETGRHKWRIFTQGLLRFSFDEVLKVSSKGSDSDALNRANGAVSFTGHEGDDVYFFEADLVKGQVYSFELTQSQPKPDAVSLWVEWITPSHAEDMKAPPAKAFEVYLPKGRDWYPIGTTKPLKGGQVIPLKPALDDLPLFVPAGSLLPQTPGIKHAADTVSETEVHIYPGLDAGFDLYDDQGDGFGYERGEYSLLRLKWHEARQSLTIGRIDGNFDGMPQERRLKLILYKGETPSIHMAVASTAGAKSIKLG